MEAILSDYDRTEIRGRGYIQQLYPKQNWDYSPLKDKAVWDVSGQTSSGPFLGEIKIRGDYHDTHDTAYLEVMKYENLKEISKNNGDLPIFYFNVYIDQTKVYNLSKLPISTYEIKNVWCPKSSTEDLGGKWKAMILIPIKEASPIEKVGFQRLKRVV